MPIWIRTAVSCIVMLLGIVAVVSRPDPSRWTGRSEIPAAKKGSEPAAPQPTTEKNPAVMTFLTRYNRCGHCEQSQLSLADAPDPVRLELQYSQWQVKATSGGFSLSRTVDQICPAHILARRENGHLSVYQNRDGGVKLSRIALLADPLQADHDGTVAAELEDGILFDNPEALEGYLESLDS